MRRFMTGCVILLMTIPSSVLAQSRYNVSNMTCDRVQAILKAEGVATLQYRSKRNPSLTLYDRYVRDAGFCAIGSQTLSGFTISVAGGKSCRVRKCVTIQSD